MNRVGGTRPLDIGTGNPEWRVRVDTTGVWRVTFAQLAAQQFPPGIAVDQVVGFRRDTTANLEPVPWTMTAIPMTDRARATSVRRRRLPALPVQNWVNRAILAGTSAAMAHDGSGSPARARDRAARVQAPSWLGATSPARPSSSPFRHYEKNYHYFPARRGAGRPVPLTDGNEDRTPVD